MPLWKRFSESFFDIFEFENRSFSWVLKNELNCAKEVEKVKYRNSIDLGFRANASNFVYFYQV